MLYESLSYLLMAWMVSAFIQAWMWIQQERTKNATSVDVVWALNIGLIALFYGIAFDRASIESRILVLTLPTLWALRLSYHLYRDRVEGAKPEDSRYAQLRRSWGQQASLNFFILYQVQAFLSCLFSIPFLCMLSIESPHFLQIVFSFLIWALAIYGESLADLQLKKFKESQPPAGLLCRRGLWSISRHPNYFFEWLVWWAYVVASPSLTRMSISLIGPALMLFLLFRVTGIPLLEERALKNKKEDFLKYKSEVPMFFPNLKKIKNIKQLF